MTKTTTYWRCTIRNKTVQCKASVSQSGEVFKEGEIGHAHPGDPGILKKVKVRAQVITYCFAVKYRITIIVYCLSTYSFTILFYHAGQTEAKQHAFRSAGDIVDAVCTQELQRTDFSLPKPANEERAANRVKQ